MRRRGPARNPRLSTLQNRQTSVFLVMDYYLVLVFISLQLFSFSFSYENHTFSFSTIGD